MSWVLLVLLMAGLGVALAVRRGELARNRGALEQRTVARARGSDRARLQHPHVDLTRCIGCGLCVSACPEDGVLELVHGQALVVHGARCVGHGRCADACPVAAIQLTLGDVSARKDLPALSEALESLTAPGVFLAGEVTGYALVRTAIGHGTAVAAEVARRAADAPGNGALDLCIVGLGPAGLACALEAKRRGLRFVAIDQEGLGGTVSRYPRRKLVMTQPVELPLHGRLARTSYLKEELVELWEQVVRENELPIRTGERFQGLERNGDGSLRVQTDRGTVETRNVCLALGRRGSPRKLGVPGEEHPKVSYSLLDAHSYQGRRILVVGGGDSAVEAALGLAEQPGNRVTLSYRKSAFFRLKGRNDAALEAALRERSLDVLLESEVERILPEAVELRVGPKGTPLTLDNDEIFVFAGGQAPFELLEAAGVSFDPALRRPTVAPGELGSGLARALLAAFALSALALAWTLYFRDYYGLPRAERFLSPLHARLRPGGAVGLAFGVAAVGMIVLNLTYLLRRSTRFPLELFSLRAWMSAHVASGLFALVLVLLHGAMAPVDSVGGHAFAGLVVLVATGAVGRYLYAFVPRAANGRELLLEETRARLEAVSAELDERGGDFGRRARERIEALTAGVRWRPSLPRRVLALLSSQRDLRKTLAALRADAHCADLAPDQVEGLEELTRRAHRAALAAAHYEDVRGLLASWRWIHRWAALLLVVLVARHVVIALRYAQLLEGSG